MMEINNGSTNSLTSYNEWFISAIKSSKVDGELQEKNLLQNCLNCYNQIKSLITTNEKEFVFKLEEFRLNSTIILLFGCPVVNTLSEIATSSEFMPLIKSIPKIDVEKFFIVLKGLKNNKYLRGVLPWLPANVLIYLLSQCLKQFSSITPLSLAISFEIFYSIVYAMQYDNVEANLVAHCLDDFVNYLNSKEFSIDSQQNCRLLAYQFMYIIESVYLLISYLTKKITDEPHTVSLGLKLKTLRTGLAKVSTSEHDSAIKNSIYTLTSTLNKMVLCITSEIWISWHEIKALSFGLLVSYENGEMDSEKPNDTSIQLQIAYTVFKLMKVSDKCELEKLLNFSNNKELECFLKQIAIDPDYDSNNDLSYTQLIDALKTVDEKKRRKLMNILLNRDDIFELKDCLGCIQEYKNFVPKSTVGTFVKKFISYLQNTSGDFEEWKAVVFDVSKNLTNKEMISIIKENLNYGHSNILMTADFSSDFTQIVNQLSNHSDKECYDSYLRLCLQSGIDVVRCSIDMSLSLPGLSSVFASALRFISFICRSAGEDGLALSTRFLIEKLDTQLSNDEEREFSLLLIHLLEKCESESDIHGHSTVDMLPVNVQEIYEKLVCPRLIMEDKGDHDILCLLEILKTIINNYPELVLESHLHLSSIIASLALIYNNTSVLHSTNFSKNLKLRNYVEVILRSLEKHIHKDLETYEKGISAVKLFLSRYKLHPLTTYVLSCVFGEMWSCGDLLVDQIFYCIMQKRLLEEQDLEIPNCRRIEWIWALYIILPNCDEDEWLNAFYLTHCYLNADIGDSNLVTPTLKVFQEVLILFCDSLSPSKDEKCKPISLHHCFKSFASCAMEFINKKSEVDADRFYTLINLFIWWCKSQRSFECDPEYPALFLNHLVTTLSDLIKANKIIIKSEKKPLKDSDMKMDTNDDGDSNTDFANTKMEEHVDNILEVSDTSEKHKANSDKMVNGFNHDSHNTLTNDDDTSHNNAVADTKCIATIVPQEEFDRFLDNMVKLFVAYVRPCEVTSAVAGKLKSLCEL